MKSGFYESGDSPISTHVTSSILTSLSSNLNDFVSDTDSGEYNLTADEYWHSTFNSAPATTSAEETPTSSLKDTTIVDDIHVDYRRRGGNFQHQQTTPTYYPAPNQIMISPRNYPGSRFVKLHGASVVNPMAATNPEAYAMFNKVPKIHGLSDRLSLRTHLQSHSSCVGD